MILIRITRPYQAEKPGLFSDGSQPGLHIHGMEEKEKLWGTEVSVNIVILPMKLSELYKV